MSIYSFSMRKEVDSLYETLYDISLTQAHSEGVCARCKEPVNLEKASANSKEEYNVFGKCFQCYSKEAAQNSIASSDIYGDN